MAKGSSALEFQYDTLGGIGNSVTELANGTAHGSMGKVGPWTHKGIRLTSICQINFIGSSWVVFDCLMRCKANAGAILSSRLLHLQDVSSLS